MLQILSEIVSIAGQSIAEQKAKHFLNAGAGGVGIAEATIDQVSIIPHWLPLGEIAALAALAVSCIMFYNTFLDIQFKRLRNEEKRIEVATLDRRSDL
jgi:hypothetical protein